MTVAISINWFALRGVTAFLALASCGAWGQSLAVHAEQGELAKSCSDDHSLRVLRVWLDALPVESRALLRDPVVRENVSTASVTPDRGVLKAIAQRIFVADAGLRTSTYQNALEAELKSLRKEFPAEKFPSSVGKALQGEDRASRLYVAAAVRIASARQPARDCGSLFRAYFVRQDERVGYLNTFNARFTGWEAIQQVTPGTSDDTFLAPGKECSPQPRGDAFFKVQPDGRMAGKFSALGFPEAVHLGLADSNDRQWSCSGVLISPQWVLTAAHCIDDGGRLSVTSKTRVSLNGKVAELRTAAGKPIQSGIIGPAAIPDDYRKGLAERLPPHEISKSDIALLQLSQPLHIARAPDSDTEGLPATVLGTLAGFGATMVSPQPRQSKPALEVGWLDLSIGKDMVAWEAKWKPAAPGSSTNASCPGDSGAPIFVTTTDAGPFTRRPAVGCFNERRILVGLVSFGQSSSQTACIQSSSGAGPRLLPHRQWICDVTKVACG